MGRGQASSPQAERIGRIIVKEHFPNPERSWIAAIRLFIALLSIYCADKPEKRFAASFIGFIHAGIL